MLEQGYAEDVARNLLLLLLVLFENVQAGNARSEQKSLLRLGPLRNPLLFWGVVLAQALHILAMYVPGLRDVLRVQPVAFEHWIVLAVVAISLLHVLEVANLIEVFVRTGEVDGKDGRDALELAADRRAGPRGAGRGELAAAGLMLPCCACERQS